MKSFTIDVQRDGRFWVIHVPGVERYTQARHLREVKPMARDLIAIMEDADPESFDVDIQVSLPPEVETALTEARRQRDLATAANAEAAHLVRSAARMLAGENGMTVRDIGAALGVSHQRVHQLIHEAESA